MITISEDQYFMKTVKKAIISFFRKEWFLILVSAVIALIFLVFEYFT